ncbi:coiled-coil domain-containing protein 122 [Aplochiton taeniatus]
MSTFRKAGNHDKDGEHGFSLTEALDDVSEQGYAQTVALRGKQQELASLQAKLSDMEHRGKEAEQDLKAKTRQMLILQGKMEHLQRQGHDTRQRSLSIYNQNIDLRFQTEDEVEEGSRLVMAGYNTYRTKMEGHRTVVSQAESLTEAHRELQEERAVVRQLIKEKEELRADLENPSGNAVRQAQREMDDLRVKISILKEAVSERREVILKEFQNHNLIKKDIQIQSRRYEAIVKRLHCQLKKAQTDHRQMSDDIHHLERQIEELKRQLKT